MKTISYDRTYTYMNINEGETGPLLLFLSLSTELAV